MTAFQILAVLLCLAAAGAYLNHRFLKAPATIGLMAIALLGSLLLVGIGKAGLLDVSRAASFVAHIDFAELLLHGLLSFLLFAGALHVDVGDLRNMKSPVAVLTTAGVVLATAITGVGFWYVAHWVGFDLRFIDALLFGALIAPTDPIAVLGILKQARVSADLRTKIGAESLFNDGVGVVIFLTLLGVATGAQKPEAAQIALLLVREALGGMAFGFGMGWLTYRLLRSIDAYTVEVLLTLALATGGYALAERLHVSAPIAMVAAGLVIGNHGRRLGMSDVTREHLDLFWELLDEILNAVLFMLMGLEILVIQFTRAHLVAGLAAIAVVLFGRLISVAFSIGLLRLRQTYDRGTIRLLTWGGLRGGISIALALSLPPGPARELILAVTYIVVIFSVLVQGLSFEWVIKWVTGRTKPARPM
jgi:CPA1 family monovalent cation:H+ antiporter